MSEMTEAEAQEFYAKNGDKPVTHAVLAEFAKASGAALRAALVRIEALEAQATCGREKAGRKGKGAK